ncbi:MAG TPA: hypothetical protein VE983_06330 [Solirubrobacteraceae bacterium]|nr:hypothetical protein [Solirubrobacteraceae bacterium]
MSPLKLLIGLRMGIGAGAWLTPRLAGRLFGLDPAGNPQLPYLGRLFGVRDVALGAGAQMSRGDSQRLWLTLGLACDAADAAAGILAGRNGEIPKLTTVLVTAPALLAIGLGGAALQAVEPEPALAS